MLVDAISLIQVQVVQLDAIAVEDQEATHGTIVVSPPGGLLKETE